MSALPRFLFLPVMRPMQLSVGEPNQVVVDPQLPVICAAGRCVFMHGCVCEPGRQPSSGVMGRMQRALHWGLSFVPSFKSQYKTIFLGSGRRLLPGCLCLGWRMPSGGCGARGLCCFTVMSTGNLPPCDRSSSGRRPALTAGLGVLQQPLPTSWH